MASSVVPLDVTPALLPERAALLDLLRGLSPDDWARPTECPGWTAKGIALHILGDDLSLLSRQRDAAMNGLVLYAVDHPGLSFRALLDGFNDLWVAASQFLSAELVIELLELVGNESGSFYREVGLDTVSGEPVGFFGEVQLSPYWQVIAREYVERFTHQSQIRRAVGAGELGGDLAAPVARVVGYALAAALRDFTASPGTRITIDFGPTGTCTWEREHDRWVVIDEDVGREAAARIVVPSTASVTMLSRGFVHDEVLSLLTVDGDESPARGAVDIIAAILARPAS